MEGKPSAVPEHVAVSLHPEQQSQQEVDICGQATHQAHADVLSVIDLGEVVNQPRAFCGFNAFHDVALRNGVAKHGGAWGFAALQQLGEQVPRLANFDRFGVRQDAVEFHPAYHELMELGLSSGAAAFAWQHMGRPGAHVIRGALMHLMYQLDQGVCCPITMTFAAVPALDMEKLGKIESDSLSFLHSFREKLISGKYCSKDVPLSSKDGATCGMSMTEKQGGDAFWLVGHKWFTSAPMSDAFLTLAQTKEGVSCFLVPRWRPDGRRNAGFNVQRLKEKVGDKSNASSEVEYRNAWGVMIGQPGRGVRTIVEMVVHTRLDCVIGSSALMRLCIGALGLRPAAAFAAADAPGPGRADMALESEAAMACWLRLARALDASSEPGEADLARIATAISKYYVCKRAPLVAYEAMECHGGNGYVEESLIARLFRQAPLNAIWEGSGNVCLDLERCMLYVLLLGERICLDILRALRKEPETATALLAELQKASELLRRLVGKGYLTTVESVRVLLGDLTDRSDLGREVADQLAICFQAMLGDRSVASCLLQYGDPMVAEAFLTTRWTQQGLATGSLGSATSSLSESAWDLATRCALFAAPVKLVSVETPRLV
eukprot:Skav231981  [mRNA]  locus=scaffold719:61956:73461:- [translate_table: standard]